MTKPLRRMIRVAVVLLVVYWLGIFTLTHIPISQPGPAIPHLDKAVHFVAYWGLAFLLPFATWTHRSWRTYALLFVLAAAYGVVDELLQNFVPNREADVWDWVADSLGAAVGLACHAVLRRWFQRRQRLHRRP